MIIVLMARLSKYYIEITRTKTCLIDFHTRKVLLYTLFSFLYASTWYPHWYFQEILHNKYFDTKLTHLVQCYKNLKFSENNCDPVWVFHTLYIVYFMKPSKIFMFSICRANSFKIAKEKNASSQIVLSSNIPCIYIKDQGQNLNTSDEWYFHRFIF